MITDQIHQNSNQTKTYNSNEQNQMEQPSNEETHIDLFKKQTSEMLTLNPLQDIQSNQNIKFFEKSHTHSQLINDLQKLKEKSEEAKKKAKEIIASKFLSDEEKLNELLSLKEKLEDKNFYYNNLFENTNNKIIKLSNKIETSTSSSYINAEKKHALSDAWSKSLLVHANLHNCIENSIFSLLTLPKISSLNKRLEEANLLITKLLITMENLCVSKLSTCNFSEDLKKDFFMGFKELNKNIFNLECQIEELIKYKDNFVLELRNILHQNSVLILKRQDRYHFPDEELKDYHLAKKNKSIQKHTLLQREIEVTWNRFCINLQKVNWKMYVFKTFKNINIKLGWCYLVAKCKTTPNRYETLKKLINLPETKFTESNLFFLDTNFPDEDSSNNFSEDCSFFLSNNHLNSENDFGFDENQSFFKENTLKSMGLIWDSEEKKTELMRAVDWQVKEFKDELKKHQVAIRENKVILENIFQNLAKKQQYVRL